jgi:hypothetical protein
MIEEFTNDVMRRKHKGNYTINMSFSGCLSKGAQSIIDSVLLSRTFVNYSTVFKSSQNKMALVKRS